MKVSQEQMAENHRRILDAAGRLFRANGFDAVSVADVMKKAGLTHGGFYGHFDSKDDLVAETLAHVLTVDRNKKVNLRSSIDAYLSPKHRDGAANGCPLASLAADIPHQTATASAAMTEGIRSQIEALSDAFPKLKSRERRRAAIGTLAAMVGALILSRSINDPQLSDEMLKETRGWIDEATS